MPPEAIDLELDLWFRDQELEDFAGSHDRHRRGFENGVIGDCLKRAEADEHQERSNEGTQTLNELFRDETRDR